jgi:hypothetical protein
MLSTARLQIESGFYAQDGLTVVNLGVALLGNDEYS